MRVLLPSLAAAAALAVALLAGCSQPPAQEPAPVAEPAPQVAFRDGGWTALPANWTLGTAGTNALGHKGAEPNIGITGDGSLFISSGSTVMRSRDAGGSWEGVQTHMLPNSDPMLWVDTLTDRVYHAPMFPTLLCATLYWSDDSGDSWATNPSADCGRGAYDHQKFATALPGPEANPLAGVSWPTVAYLCYNGVAVTNCAVSYDGGLTWPVDRPTQVNVVPPPEGSGAFTGCSSGQNGHPTGAPDGTIVFMRTGPGCPMPLLASSRDSGLTWTLRQGPPSPNPTSLDPEVAFTPDGTMYVLYQDADFQEMLARSRDMGQTWEGPWPVMPPGVKTASFQALAAGSDGRVALAFLGTRDDDGSPSDVSDSAHWHLFVVASEDAAAEAPTFVAYQATPDSDPVQVGPIWQGGGGDPSRNLLDFIDGAVAPDGSFYVAFADGCTSDACKAPDAKGDDSRDRATSVGWLKGWSLYAPGEGRPATLA